MSTEQDNDKIVVEERIAPENEEDEIQPPSAITTQYGRTSRKPELLQFCLRSYCYDQDLNRYLDDGKGRVLESSFFTDGLTITEEAKMDYEEKIEPMTMDEFQCYLETLEWYEFDPQEISAMVFEQRQMSI